MKPNPFKTSTFISLSRLITVITTLFYSTHAAPLGTAFTYQGRLVDNGSPASGNYDLRFTLYDALSGGNTIGVPIANAPTVVSNGLFTVTLDFGGGIFLGNARWLEIGVRTNGSVLAYTLLTPRQELTPAPNALYAPNAGTATTANGVAAGSVGTAGLAPNAVNSSIIANGSIVANDLSASLLANIALLDRTPQTFTGANIFDRGSGGPGRLIVNGSSSPDTTAFTGLGFQYYAGEGEGAIMSSYNDGVSFLSFYTKSAPGQPIAQRMIIDRYGNVAVDQSGSNDGLLNNSTLGGAGLSFGIASGEGIASKRTAGGNQWGLDFFTAGIPRMSLSNSGNLSFADPANSILFPATGGANNPMIYMFASGTANANRMVIAHSPSYPNWGLQYSDPQDKFIFLAAGSPVMSVLLGNGRVGVGTATPSSSLHVVGDTRLGGDLVMDGAIKVSGAGVGTSTAAFVQVCALANQTAPHRTTISNPLCDGNPNAILLVTHNYNPGGTGGNLQTHPFSVWYNGSNSKWEIYNDDFVAMPVGTSFNVLIITP